MSANTVRSNDEAQLSEIEQKAVEIIETACEEDTVLFNDRVQPLTVDTVMGPHEGRSGFDYLELEGPRGGKYMLLHRDGSRVSKEQVKLQRATGEYNDDYGFPEYEDLNLNSIELVDHHEWRIGQVFEVPEPIRGDEYYHVVTDLSHSGCYDAETAGVRVEDGEVAETTQEGLFNSIAKEKIFNDDLVLVDELPVGYNGDRGVHYDAERQEQVRLSDPHRRGVDCRRTERTDEGRGLEVVGWETILFGFEDRFQDEAPDEQKQIIADGGTIEDASNHTSTLSKCPNCGEQDDLVAGDDYDGRAFSADDTVCLGCDRVFDSGGEWFGGVNSEVAEELHSTFIDALSEKVALDPSEEIDEETAELTMEFFRYAHGGTMLRQDRLEDVVEYWLLHYYDTQKGMSVFEVDHSSNEGEAVVQTNAEDITLPHPKETVVNYASKVIYGDDERLDEDIRQARAEYGFIAEPGELE